MLDVGGVYDPAKDRYDHHQKGFEEIFGNGFNTKLSSAGLVYKVIFFLLFLILCTSNFFYVKYNALILWFCWLLPLVEITIFTIDKSTCFLKLLYCSWIALDYFNMIIVPLVHSQDYFLYFGFSLCLCLGFVISFRANLVCASYM